MRRLAVCRPEPRLDELLSDPLIRLVMASDAVEEADIRRLARSAGRRGAAPGLRPAPLER